MIKTKSVSSPIDRKSDGLRILVTRYLVRYLRTTRYDVWMPSLAASETLLKGTQAAWKAREQKRDGREWNAEDHRVEARATRKYHALYKQELFEGEKIDSRNPRIKNKGQKFTLRLLQKLGKRGHVTLLCHCAEDATGCHRHALKKILDGKI